MSNYTWKNTVWLLIQLPTICFQGQYCQNPILWKVGSNNTRREIFICKFILILIKQISISYVWLHSNHNLVDHHRQTGRTIARLWEQGCRPRGHRWWRRCDYIQHSELHVADCGTDSGSTVLPDLLRGVPHHGHRLCCRQIIILWNKSSQTLEKHAIALKMTEMKWPPLCRLHFHLNFFPRIQFPYFSIGSDNVLPSGRPATTHAMELLTI